jgi:chlorophyll synthase
LKPITWFPPMWAYMCGAVSAGVPLGEHWPALLLGMLLAGPFVCGTSQAVNDWYDRDVDAINEPGRPIPSGRIPGQWGLAIAILGTLASLALAALLGPVVLAATIVGLLLAWGYSAPPLRLKRSGWLGPLAVAIAYEGLTWFTGAAVMQGAVPGAPQLWLAGLYAAGAFGIMTLNDFKAVEGDARMGIASLPVTLGVRPAAVLACLAMLVPQLAVIGLLLHWEALLAAGGVLLLVVGQLGLMARLLGDPARLAPWFNATGTTLYVLGMLVAAFGVRGLGGSA